MPRENFSLSISNQPTMKKNNNSVGAGVEEEGRGGEGKRRSEEGAENCEWKHVEKAHKNVLEKCLERGRTAWQIAATSDDQRH